ncbi:hypothetical protein MKW94_013972 [Papaver nudicaule]|uniref:Uncharacterized protein n=1 Tax=Papaver nudicaule TaxID=74823 RepID=A0AA41SER3_PAPNU|nr:hypothetical protein [Papaver nudicaule]
MAVAADKGVVVVVDDMGGDMQCSNHPYKNNNNPGGICAFCLQEKLGRLVSSSKSDPSFFPVNTPPAKTAAAAAAHDNKTTTSTTTSNSIRKSPIAATNSCSLSEQQHQNNKLVMLKRSKSSAASNTRRIISHEPRHQIFDNDDEEEELGTNEYSPAAAKSATSRNKHHRGFWSSFLHLTSASNRTSKRTIRSSPYGGERDHRDRVAVLSNTTAVNTGIITISSTIAEREKHLGGGNESSSSNGVAVAVSSTRTRDTIGDYGDENDSPNSSSHASSSSNSFGRKVARSRSVGCGSRSFSGAFLEKISTGFGDCSTLRRVESQRESSATNSNYHNTNNKMVAVDDHHRRNHHRHIKCGGIFGGFTMTNTGNSISNGGRVVAAVVGPPHGRSKNWGWAFASPMRAFRPPTSSSSSSSSKPDGSVVAAAPKDIWFV